MNYEVAQNGINIQNPIDQIPTGIDLEEYAAKVTLIPYHLELKADQRRLNQIADHIENCGCGACRIQFNRFVSEYNNKYLVPQEP